MLPRVALRGVRVARMPRMAVRAFSEEVSGLKLNLCSPAETIYKDKIVERVIIPGADGEYGVTAGHSPIVAELKPGVVQVKHEGSDEPEKFFVSGGFALSHEDSVTDISAPEIARVEDLDENLVRDGLAKASDKLAAASSDLDKAFAQIEVNTFKAMGAALGMSV